MNKIQGQIVDIPNQKIFSGEIIFDNKEIIKIREAKHDNKNYILPGFIDSHIHIESSMLVPSEFARLAIKHGTVATISDPHEIANVLGAKGVDFMIENGQKVPFHFYFGAPSCVPATAFETAGDVIDSEGIKQLLERKEIHYLAEMMNFPGVIHQDKEVIKKIEWAKHFGKPIDGHAPGLRGEDAKKYFSKGISTDHECFTYEEAKEKLKLGIKVLIREGSAAKNFEALIPLIKEFPNQIMFCSDDKHPDELLLGHINKIVARAIKLGYDLFDVLSASCINPIEHYNLHIGALKERDPADFIVIQDLEEFEVLQTYINGKCIFKEGKSKIDSVEFSCPNRFSIQPKKEKEFQLKVESDSIRIIQAIDGELITKQKTGIPLKDNGFWSADITQDFLKISVVNRYQEEKPAISFIQGFGLQNGAIASSVAHDCHNIVVVGTSDEMIQKAVNAIVENRGGISVVNESEVKTLPLPVAGIMSDKSAEEVGEKYQELDALAKKMGSKLSAPFMTLSFMALLVIPSLKLSDKGLFDGNQFKFVSNSV